MPAASLTSAVILTLPSVKACTSAPVNVTLHAPPVIIVAVLAAPPVTDTDTICPSAPFDVPMMMTSESSSVPLILSSPATVLKASVGAVVSTVTVFVDTALRLPAASTVYTLYAPSTKPVAAKLVSVSAAVMVTLLY